MASVFIVERMYLIEDYYECDTVVRVFSTKEKADGWIEDKLAKAAVVRAASVRRQELERKISDEIMVAPFSEPRPPDPPRWAPGLKQSEITQEMQEERANARAAQNDWCNRYNSSRKAREELVEAALKEAWEAEGQAMALDDVPKHPHEPLVYSVTEAFLDEDVPVKMSPRNIREY